MTRSLVTVDVGAIRDNARALARVLGRSELWAVVKADGYGHGAADSGRAALEGGATTLCVATVGEALVLRAELPDARVVVLGPTAPADVPPAREARLELAVADERLPEGVPLHLKLDSGMGRWGLGELPAPGAAVVGLMTHFATADSDPAFADEQLGRFLAATAAYNGRVTRHAANSAAALTLPASRLDAARCGIALYGIDPLGTDPARFGLRPALRWESELVQVRRLGRGRAPGTAAASSRRTRRGSGSSRSATPTGSGVTCPARRSSSAAFARRSSARCRWTHSRSGSRCRWSAGPR